MYIKYMAHPRTPVSIFQYTNYRTFLNDIYEEKKKANSKFSYQYFARKAGFKAKTFIFKVLKGQKALPKSGVFRVAKALGLGKKETDYFEAIVNFLHAKSVDERDFYFQRMQSLTPNHPAAELRRSQYQYFSQWYYAPLRELVAMNNFKNDYKTLAKQLSPSITPAKAKKAVKFLVQLGLVKKLPSGKYEQTNKAITTGDEVQSLAVQKFQKENMKLAAEAIDRHKRETRDISTLTAGLSKVGFEKIKAEIQAFRKKLVEIADKDQTPERVYQINFQLFPLCTLPKEEHKT
jgi:uncharacterized protein (TIGR02147 family)